MDFDLRKNPMVELMWYVKKLQEQLDTVVGLTEDFIRAYENGKKHDVYDVKLISGQLTVIRATYVDIMEEYLKVLKSLGTRMVLLWKD